jgi:tripartite-type tricarboxylate transporter receptor subunit TctC
MKRRTLCSVIAAVLMAPLMLPLANAQSEADLKAQIAKLKPKDFPSQPIELTVVYPAGGAVDVSARHVGKYFEKWSGQKAIVNNRTGGAGIVGHTHLASQAKNDGYTLGVVASLIFADSMLRAQGRWTMNDLEPIAYLNSDGLNAIVSTDGPYKDKSFKDMVELAKQKPGTVRVATVPNSVFEYMVDQLELVTGAKFLKVPFQGGAPAIAAVLGNHVDISIGFHAEFLSMLDAKKIKPIAVASVERSPYLPDVPTVNELLGRKDVVWGATRWVTAPKGIPADRKAYLVAAFNAAIQDPELQAEFRKVGSVPDARFTTPTQVAEHLNRLAGLERDFYVKSGRLK